MANQKFWPTTADEVGPRTQFALTIAQNAIQDHDDAIVALNEKVDAISATVNPVTPVAPIVVSGITELTGDVQAGPGTGSQPATLSDTAVTPGSYSSTNLTVDSKGRITAASNGAGGANFSDAEVPTGVIDGANVTFTLANVPNPALSLIASLAGLIQWQNASGDYTITAGTMTFVVAPTLGPLICWYRY